MNVNSTLNLPTAELNLDFFDVTPKFPRNLKSINHDLHQRHCPLDYPAIFCVSVGRNRMRIYFRFGCQTGKSGSDFGNLDIGVSAIMIFFR